MRRLIKGYSIWQQWKDVWDDSLDLKISPKEYEWREKHNIFFALFVPILAIFIVIPILLLERFRTIRK